MQDENARIMLMHEIVSEMRKNCQRTWYKPMRVYVYADPKCPYCDKDRMIHAVAANGQELVDDCQCGRKEKLVWTAKPVTISAYVVSIQDGHAVVFPSKIDGEEDGRNAEILVSWWADPEPDDRTPPDIRLSNSVFSTYERFEDYCNKAGAALMKPDMEEAK